ncbi:hypothetical protein V6N12_075805 [Hibiscus sabdariffa]|uniref:Uncharacterized protein n=1 Tax=Hibiscus sabdariffa TaxID=183260 RepID=A0ABR2C8N8_9ROSI
MMRETPFRRRENESLGISARIMRAELPRLHESFNLVLALRKFRFSGGNDSSPVENSLDFDDDDDDIELLEDDIVIGDSNGISSIDFSERVQQLTIKSMDLALVATPSRLMAWIRLPGLPMILYKRSFIEAIGKGNVIKMDFQTDNGCMDICPKNMVPSEDCPMHRETVPSGSYSGGGSSAG